MGKDKIANNAPFVEVLATIAAIIVVAEHKSIIPRNNMKENRSISP